jgi:hypothetical protein
MTKTLEIIFTPNQGVITSEAESDSETLLVPSGPSVIEVESVPQSLFSMVTKTMSIIPGDIGNGGDSFSTYVYHQGAPSKDWIVYHNLDCFPSITVVDSSQNVVIGNVEYLNSNAVMISFSGEFSGKAYIN